MQNEFAILKRAAKFLLSTIFLVTSTSVVSGADLVWTNNSGGDWQSASNWSPNQIPGPTDNVTLSINSRVTNSAAASVSNLTFSAGNMIGGGFLTVNGAATWTGGDLCSGIAVAPGASLAISNTPSFGFNNGAQNGGGSITNHGTVIWAGTTLYGYGGANIHNAGLWQVALNNNIANQGGTNKFTNVGTMEKVAGTSSATIGWEFNSTGTINTPTGTFAINNFVGSTVFNGLAQISFSTLKASLTVASDAVLNWTGGDVTGELTVAPGGTLTITNSVTFGNNGGSQNGGGSLTNHGSVIFAGAAHYGYGGATIHNAGLWQIAGNNNLSNQNGTNKFINTGTLEKIVGSSTATIGWEFTTTGALNTPSGSLQLNNWVGTNVLQGTVRWAGGAMNGMLHVPGGSSLHWSSGNVNGTMTVQGTAHWSGGDLSGALTVVAGGSLSISNSVSFSNNGGSLNGGGSLTNNGSVICAGTSHYGYGNSVVHNAGLWQMAASNNFLNQSGTNTFINTGTLEKFQE